MADHELLALIGRLTLESATTAGQEVEEEKRERGAAAAGWYEQAAELAMASMAGAAAVKYNRLAAEASS